MDRSLKERLVGAAVLVALGVWLIPWVLDGSAVDTPADSPDVALKLPVPEAGSGAPIRRETIELGARGSKTPEAGAPEPSAAAATQTAPETTQQATPQAVREPATAAATAPDAGATPGAGTDSSAQSPAGSPAASAVTQARSAATPADGQRTAAGQTAGAGQTADQNEDETVAAAGGGATDTPAPAGTAQSARAADILAASPVAGWMVQLGSFSDAGNARRQAQRVGTFGHDARIYEFSAAGGRKMFRVRLGPVETRERAEAAASALTAHGFVAQLVAPE